MKRFAIVLGVTAGLVLPAGAQAHVQSCHYSYGHGPRNDRNVPIGGVSVRNMTCPAGLHAISVGDLSRSFRTPGFHCYALKIYRMNGLTMGADIRCVHGSQAFRFSWAT